MLNRRNFMLTGFGAALFTRSVWAQSSQLEVFKSPTCGCCSAWIDHMAQAGFQTVARDVDHATLQAIKARVGVAPKLSSCHTALIAGYFVEGHVPAEDVQRLLSERPDALGLTVPGMPIGSPGMEMGNQREAFETFLVLSDGSTTVFNRHA